MAGQYARLGFCVDVEEKKVQIVQVLRKIVYRYTTICVLCCS